MTTVFVYGTLMPGERNAHVAGENTAFAARPATLRGFRLLHLSPEGYPAVIPGGASDSIQGQALTYSAQQWTAALPYLDELEGLNETPPLYTRKKVMVQVENGAEIGAWVYLYARPERLQQMGATSVPSGDWRTVAQRYAPSTDDKNSALLGDERAAKPG